MGDKLRLGIVGLGNRGQGLLETCIIPEESVEVCSVCDLLEERRSRTLAMFKAAGKNLPKTAEHYREILADEDVDAVIFTTSWESHINLACEAMRAGKYAAIEVGGAYSVEDCWKLVRTHEETGVHCMFLENCCYGRTELMVANMVRQGVLGEIVHCRGGYMHDIRDEIAFGRENNHYRFRNYLSRNAENYPTHQLGPISRILQINRGNRMLSLVSVASKASGLHAFFDRERGEAYDATHWNFKQGDIVSTVIKCAGGETIALTLDTTLPRPYSRDFQVHGTKGMYSEESNSFFLDGVDDEFHENWQKRWNNAEEYREKYDHPLWRNYSERGGHGGMDWLVLQDFFSAAKKNLPAPIDVYDAAAWMSITCLSEQSISTGGMPVAIPDFTNGMWLRSAPPDFGADSNLTID